MPENRPKVPLAVYLVGILGLIPLVEFYKIENGDYPDSLQQLSKKTRWIFTADPTQLNHLQKTVYFQYAHLGDHYTLFSVGPDGIAHTSDDIFPVIPDTGRIHYGWVKE